MIHIRKDVISGIQFRYTQILFRRWWTSKPNTTKRQNAKAVAPAAICSRVIAAALAHDLPLREEFWAMVPGYGRKLVRLIPDCDIDPDDVLDLFSGHERLLMGVQPSNVARWRAAANCPANTEVSDLPK